MTEDNQKNFFFLFYKTISQIWGQPTRKGE